MPPGQPDRREADHCDGERGRLRRVDARRHGPLHEAGGLTAATGPAVGYSVPMTRRRLALANLAVLALGAAWWWFATGLSVEERRLVGTWRMHRYVAGQPGRQGDTGVVPAHRGFRPRAQGAAPGGGAPGG